VRVRLLAPATVNGASAEWKSFTEVLAAEKSQVVYTMQPGQELFHNQDVSQRLFLGAEGAQQRDNPLLLFLILVPLPTLGTSSSTTHSLPAAAAATFPAPRLHQVVPNSTGIVCAPASPPSPRLASAVARHALESDPLVLFYLERRVFQNSALQARFRSRTSL
jgi:hypothetical protein